MKGSMQDGLTNFTLDSVSVIILAREHNPTIVNPDFLKGNGIVGSDWETADNPPLLSSPGLAIVSFRNGIQWHVDPNNLTIQEEVNGDFKESYLVHKCAEKYVEVLRYVPYTALGMNWHLSIGAEEPLNWVKNRFLREGEWQSSIEPLSIGFKIPPSWTLTLNVRGRGNERSIGLDCNHHTEIGHEYRELERIRLALNKFSSFQEDLKQTLKKYFEEKLS